MKPLESSELRYSRNIRALSHEEVKSLHTKKVCIVGLGGLGGYVVEILARIGVLNITAVDYDVFEHNNLNRQLFSTEALLGHPKTEGAGSRIKAVNSAVQLNLIGEKLTESNALGVLQGHDCVVDALDNIPSRLLLQDTCEKLGVPMVHGSIAGWFGQVAAIFPGDKLFQKIFKNVSVDGTVPEKGVERELGNLPFTASTVASMQAAEVVKILCGRQVLRNTLTQIDLLDFEFNTLYFGDKS
ncbi:MAG: HesA/MoeB/ThiF family protein [Oscillospiraceae bacterium]|nr:HesA/MoeB/ThiF family protein [Oscillospiraceae bacterium]